MATPPPSITEQYTAAMNEQQNFNILLKSKAFTETASSRSLQRRLDFAFNNNKTVTKITKILREDYNTQPFKISWAFIICLTKKTSQTIPIMRIVDEERFFDGNCRVYSSWIRFLSENRLQKCVMCYPENGVYCENLRLCFEWSQACQFVNDLGKLLYYSAVTVGVVTGVVGVASSFVVLGPTTVIAVVSVSIVNEGFLAARAFYKLKDRHTHRQTLLPTSSEARGHWLGVASFLAGTLAGASQAVKAAGGAKVALTKGLAVKLGIGVGKTVKTIGFTNCLFTNAMKCSKRNFAEAEYFFTDVDINVVE